MWETRAIPLRCRHATLFETIICKDHCKRRNRSMTEETKKYRRKRMGLVLAVASACLCGVYMVSSHISAYSKQSKATAKGRLAFSHDLPKLDGDHLQAKLAEVIYGPGGSSPAHSHPCPVIGYVVEGS